MRRERLLAVPDLDEADRAWAIRMLRGMSQAHEHLADYLEQGYDLTDPSEWEGITAHMERQAGYLAAIAGARIAGEPPADAQEAQAGARWYVRAIRRARELLGWSEAED